MGYFPKEKFLIKMIQTRVAPDTKLAGYPAAGYQGILFAGYPAE